MAAKDKRENLRFTIEECLLMLRSYIVHQGDYQSIVEEIRANKNHLTPQVNQFYEGSDFKKIKQRMREKIQRLVATRKQQKDLEIREELEVIFCIENRTVESTYTACSSQSNPLKLKLQKKSCAVGAPPRASSADENSDDLPDPALSPVKPCNSKPIPRPSSSRSLVAVQDEEDVRLHWARKVAKKCEKSKKKKSKKNKKGKSTRELMKENEEMKNEVLKYLVKNKQKILQESSSSSPETSTSLID